MQNRTWFITGINRGLGRALAEGLLERGHRVAGTSRKPDELDDLKATYGDNLWVAALDLTDAANIQKVVDDAFAELGRIDIVVNNAGYSLVGAAEECPQDMTRHIFNTNLLGSIFVIQAALPHFRAQGSGRIYQISSSLGQTSAPGISLYVSSKWGIEGFIESLAPEVAPFGIETTIFEPGTIRTNFGAAAQLTPANPAYDDTPARVIRNMAMGRGNPDSHSGPLGDPVKMAQVIIDSAEQSPAPKRVAMGSDAYNSALAAISERKALLEAQKELAFSTDH